MLISPPFRSGGSPHRRSAVLLCGREHIYSYTPERVSDKTGDWCEGPTHMIPGMFPSRRSVCVCGRICGRCMPSIHTAYLRSVKPNKIQPDEWNERGKGRELSTIQADRYGHACVLLKAGTTVPNAPNNRGGDSRTIRVLGRALHTKFLKTLMVVSCRR